MTLGEDVPAGMRLGDYNRHPVRQMIALAGAYGERALPTEAEIDKLGLSPRDRKALEIGLADVAALRDDPDRATYAVEEAERRAGEIIGGLPTEQRNPAWYTRVERDLTQMTPRQLADLVPEMWS